MDPNDLANPQNPAEQVQMMQLLQQLASQNPAARSAMAKIANNQQRVILPVPYWSVAEWSGTPTAGAIAITTDRRSFFQYAQGQDMAVAGAAGRVATYADTNLQRQGETLSNADVWIYGVCLEIEPGSEPLIVQALWADAYVDISTDGQNAIRLGTPAMFPSAGGLYGVGQSADVLPPDPVSGIVTDGGPGADKTYLSNGNPIAGSFIRFPQPFKWGGVGQGGADASLTIGMTLTRPLTITLPANRAAASPTGGYTAPTAAGQPGTFARIRARLISQSVNRRSQNT